jgi:diguanylate cyclase (GGDEF)-like protein
VILGLQAVKTLALGFSLLTNLKTQAGGNSDGFDYMYFWKRSIYTGVAGRLLARKLNLVQQEEAFLCGLLADIGILVMHKVIGPDYDMIYVQAAGDQDALIGLCRQKFNTDHAEVGSMLAEHWQLPPVLAKPIAQHHCVTETDAHLRPLLEVVFVASIIGDVFSSINPARHIMRAREQMAERFKLSQDDIEALLAEIGASTREAARLFELNIGQNRSYQEILDEAQQTLIQLSLQSQQQVQTIRKENETLQVKATTDPLTGLANRARFNDFFDDQFARAYKQQRPLAVLFLDIDHFKKVNDTYGHQAGDEVLKRVGKLLKLAVRNIDLAARYGGEEFAVVLTETDSNAAAQMADEIRQALESEQIHFDNKVLRITGSIGVAGTDRTRIFSQSGQLTNAADRAVYAAKAAGRNCVRLFRPKVQAPAATSAQPVNPVAR